MPTFCKLHRLLPPALLAITLCLTMDRAASAQDAEIATTDLKVIADTVWTLVAAFLVFWMNAGFGCVESGFTRAKNAVNILGKNFVVFGIASLSYWIIGFGLMFGDGNALLGTTGFFVNPAQDSDSFSSLDWANIPLFAKFFFQLVFAGTAATIVSGCVAERIHYWSYMLFSMFLVALVYPIGGHWIWGGGWLGNLGFQDFAGSTVVHSVGGWAGLIGILLLGSRTGKYDAAGKPLPIPGHNMALAFLGGMILWLGWFGFNPGSFMAADAEGISHVVVTTNLACSAGLLAATVTAWLLLGKPDFSMTVNGALAGLVAITAPCAYVGAFESVIIGLVGGILVVLGVLAFDRLHVDDPVGALSVHLLNGIWGTIAVGLFASSNSPGGGADGLFHGGGLKLLLVQLLGILAIGVFTVVASAIGWLVIRATVGMRVDAETELVGLDIVEMGMEAYPAEPAHTTHAASSGARESRPQPRASAVTS